MNTVTTSKESQVTREDVSKERNYLSPEVNIYETKEGYVLEAEMPGVDKHGLEITLERNLLTFVGHRADTIPTANLLYRESRPVDFRRIFELDPAIDTARINAKIEQGILTLHLPKTEKVKPRKIAVND